MGHGAAGIACLLLDHVNIRRAQQGLPLARALAVVNTLTNACNLLCLGCQDHLTFARGDGLCTRSIPLSISHLLVSTKQMEYTKQRNHVQYNSSSSRSGSWLVELLIVAIQLLCIVTGSLHPILRSARCPLAGIPVCPPQFSLAPTELDLNPPNTGSGGTILQTQPPRAISAELLHLPTPQPCFAGDT